MFPEIGDQEAKRKRIKPIPILQASGQAQAVFGKVPPLRTHKSLLERQKTRFVCKVWPISMLLDPDPRSQYGSGPGSKTAK
jgi:hypothetical protein